MEDVVAPNDGGINYEIIINDDNILDSEIDTLQNEILEIEGVNNETPSENEGVDNEVLIPERKGYYSRNLPIITTMTEDPIGDPWAGTICLLDPIPSTISQRPMPTS